MKVEEATRVKEKLDDVLLAVEEYGKQSEQFSKARNDLFEVLGVMHNTNASLGQLLTACDEYLKKASEVIDGDYFIKIQGVINEINNTAVNLERCNENTALESVKLIDDSKKQLSELADALSKNIQSSIKEISNTANDLQVYSKQASDNANALIKSSSNEILDLVSKLRETCDTLLKEYEQLQTNDANIIDLQKKTSSDIFNVRDFLAEKIQSNNELCINIVAKLSDIETNSANNKEEIIKEIKTKYHELQDIEDKHFNILNDLINDNYSSVRKFINKFIIAGGIIAIIVIALQVVNIIF